MKDRSRIDEDGEDEAMTITPLPQIVFHQKVWDVVPPDPDTPSPPPLPPVFSVRPCLVSHVPGPNGSRWVWAGGIQFRCTHTHTHARTRRVQQVPGVCG